MTISKVQCLYVFLALYGATIFAIFARAFPRRRLLADHADLQGGQTADLQEHLAKRILLAIPRQSMALRDLGHSIANAPPAVQSRYRLFRALTWVCFLLFSLLVMFSLGAHKVCPA